MSEEPKEKETRVTDKELRAMADIVTRLSMLDERERGRVVDWLIDRYPSPAK